MKFSMQSLMLRSLWVVPLVICLIVFLLFLVPVSREAASFTDVNSPDKHTDSIFGHYLPGKPNGDFIIYDNKLYLKVQGLSRAIVLVTFVRRYEWSTEKLAKFRTEHPELEPYLPDGTKHNAGIAWISE